jgi:hypothetical protein
MKTKPKRYDILVRCRHCGCRHGYEDLTQEEIDSLTDGPPTKCTGFPGGNHWPHMESDKEWTEHFEIIEQTVHTTTRHG